MSKKPWYQSKTVWVNILTLAAATLALTADQPWLTKNALSAIVYAQGLVNIGLRFVTNQPLSLGKG